MGDGTAVGSRLQTVARSAALCIIVVTVLAPGLDGQSLLERWLVDYSADLWRPRWAWAEARGDLISPTTSGVTFTSRFDALSLPSTSQRRHRVDFQARQVVGSAGHLVRVGLVSDGRTFAAASRPVLSTEAAPAVSAGVDLRPGFKLLGRWTMTGLLAWDRGPGGLAGLVGEGAWHRIEVYHWRSSARYSRFQFAPDSLQDMGEAHRMIGTRAAAQVRIPVGGLNVLGVGGRLEWDDVRGDAGTGTAFLSVSPSGSVRAREFFLTSEFESGIGIRVAHRTQDTDLDAPITRLEESAGKVYFGRLQYRRWSADVWHVGATARWGIAFGMDKIDSEVSASVETWPFVSLWEQLGARAYRFRGSLGGDAVWTRLSRLPTHETGKGLGWTVDAGVYSLRSTKDDWYVNNLGIGRTGRDSTSSTVSPVVVVGGSLQHGFGVVGSDLILQIEAGLPVYAHGDQPSTARLSGYIGLGANWHW